MPKIDAAKIARSSFWLTASFLIAKASQFIAQIFLARLLSPEDFGVWAMVLIITVLADLFQDKSIAQVLVQRGLEDKVLVNAVYSLGVNISIGMFVVQALVGLPLSHAFDRPILFPLVAVVGLKFLIGAGAGSHGAIMQRQMRFRNLAICDALAGFVRMLAGIASAFFGAGIWAFVIAELSFALVDSLSKKLLSGYRFSYQLIPDAMAIKNVRNYISSIISINLAVYFNTNGDNFIIAKLLGATSLGYYNLAYQLAMLPTFALSQFNRVCLSALSQKEDAGKRKLVLKSLELYSLVYAPMYGVASLIAPWLIPWFYGQAWIPAVPIFQLIIIYSYTRGFMQTLGTTLNSLDKPTINARINWALVPLSISAFWVGATLGGVRGVAIAAVMVMGLGGAIWFQLVVCRVTGWSMWRLLRSYGLPSLAILISFTLVKGMVMTINLNSVWQLVCLLIFYALIVSVASAGRIPHMLMQTTYQILKRT